MVSVFIRYSTYCVFTFPMFYTLCNCISVNVGFFLLFSHAGAPKDVSYEVSFYVYFAPSKYNVLVQNWQDPDPTLSLGSDHIKVIVKFVYLVSSVSAGGGVSDEINARIVKTRVAYANLGHLWRIRDISLAVKSRIYNASVRAVLLYACGTWPLRVEDVRRLSVFDHRCVRRIADIQWQRHVGNADVRHRVFGHRDDNSIGVTVLKHRLRWLGHVLRMSSQRISRRALFAESGTGQIWRCGQCLAWCRDAFLSGSVNFHLMSQVTNTTTGISNNNNSNNTPWNRTPGKPGIGTGGTVNSYPTFSTPSNIPWSTTRNDAVDLIQGRGQIEDTINKIPTIHSLMSYDNNPKNSDTTITTGGGVGQMWPLPAIFDSSRNSDRNAVGGGVGEWATTPFSGQTTSNVSSLLGSPNTFPISNNHIQVLNPWSFDNPNNNCSITAPRAITGQQLNNVTLANTPSDTLNSDRSRRYMQHWTTLNNEQDLLNGMCVFLSYLFKT
ncbi:unnamed protein product [Schistosoma curassoni]|uniref:C2H2-type domain-containing protein n=1 Tax=Schistosoma curassoni TaxID=6186 RepID=A0A183KT34_9TREM|nr:unnamed protein product [Schistosoma curassoni]